MLCFNESGDVVKTKNESVIAKQKDLICTFDEYVRVLLRRTGKTAKSEREIEEGKERKAMRLNEMCDRKPIDPQRGAKKI